MKTSLLSNILSFPASRVGAMVCIALASTAAHATFYYFDLSTPISLTTAAPLIYLDVTTGEHNTFAIDDWDINIYKSSGPAGGLRFAAPTGGGYLGASLNSPLNLAYDTAIGANQQGSFYGGGGLGTAFENPGTKIAGFEFLNPTSGITNYGWIELTTGETRGYPASIDSWGYDDSGATVYAGIPSLVPEPAPVAALGLGVLVLLRRRRRS
jgi:hypothetical protein